MSRKSARFVAEKVFMRTTVVYDIWRDMGLVMKDKFGDWVLTDLGRKIGGRMSDGNRLSVPTFEFEIIEKMMDRFLQQK